MRIAVFYLKKKRIKHKESNGVFYTLAYGIFYHTMYAK